MNAQARIVETYFRLVRNCFTISDVKVCGGNNRQFDILAYQPIDNKYFHVEVSVTHRKNWCPTLGELEDSFNEKFFGCPKNKRPDNKDTDFAKGKTYNKQIEKTYKSYGIKFDEAIRVWCYWDYKESAEEETDLKRRIAKRFKLASENFELLSFKDEVIPKLMAQIGTSNYDDEIVRTLSLLKQYDRQKGDAAKHNDKKQNNCGASFIRTIGRDYTKYLFNGKEYKKGRLVLAVVKKYLEDNTKISYEKLREIFPDNLQGSCGVFKQKNDAEKKQKGNKKRYFTKPEELLKTNDGVEITVSDQWGVGNIKKFLDHATKKLGYIIEKKGSK